MRISAADLGDCRRIELAGFMISLFGQLKAGKCKKQQYAINTIDRPIISHYSELLTKKKCPTVPASSHSSFKRMKNQFFKFKPTKELVMLVTSDSAAGDPSPNLGRT